jgi:hypothetical protein
MRRDERGTAGVVTCSPAGPRPVPPGPRRSGRGAPVGCGWLTAQRGRHDDGPLLWNAKRSAPLSAEGWRCGDCRRPLGRPARARPPGRAQQAVPALRADEGLAQPGHVRVAGGGALILLRGQFGSNAAETLAFKLWARSFIQLPECADVPVECALSNDSNIRCASEPGRTETQTETPQDHRIGNP